MVWCFLCQGQTRSHWSSHCLYKPILVLTKFRRPSILDIDEDIACYYTVVENLLSRKLKSLDNRTYNNYGLCISFVCPCSYLSLNKEQGKVSRHGQRIIALSPMLWHKYSLHDGGEFQFFRVGAFLSRLMYSCPHSLNRPWNHQFFFIWISSDIIAFHSKFNLNFKIIQSREIRLSKQNEHYNIEK